MVWRGARLQEWGKTGFLSQEVGPDGWVALRAVAWGPVAPHHGQLAATKQGLVLAYLPSHIWGQSGEEGPSYLM